MLLPLFGLAAFVLLVLLLPALGPGGFLLGVLCLTAVFAIRELFD